MNSVFVFGFAVLILGCAFDGCREFIRWYRNRSTPKYPINFSMGEQYREIDEVYGRLCDDYMVSLQAGRINNYEYTQLCRQARLDRDEQRSRVTRVF